MFYITDWIPKPHLKYNSGTCMIFIVSINIAFNALIIFFNFTKKFIKERRKRQYYKKLKHHKKIILEKFKKPYQMRFALQSIKENKPYA
jgi:hypothetical protein